MFKKLLFVSALCLVGLPAFAQNPQCPTRPLGDSTNACASTAFVAAAVGAAGGIILTDTFFGSGRPWCDVRALGATGNGSTNDTPAFAACLSILDTTTNGQGGIIYVPTGTYCLTTGFTVNEPSRTIHVIGEATGNTRLSACNADINPFSFTSLNGSVERLTILGYNAVAPSTTSSALKIINCPVCVIRDVQIQFGWSGIDSSGAEPIYDNVTISAVYGTYMHRIAGGGAVLKKVSYDQQWIGATPGYGTTFAAWQSTHNYNVANTVVTMVQSGVTFLVQLTQTGTSGGSQPTILPFGAGNFTDGTAQWHIIGNSNLIGLLLDGGTNGVWVDNGSDFTGAEIGIALQNNVGGNNPANIYLNKVSVGSTGSGILAQVGHDLYIDTPNVGPCITTGCSGVDFKSTFTGNSVVMGGLIAGNLNGVHLSGGSGYSISGINFQSGITNSNGVLVDAGVSKWSVTGNIFGAPSVSIGVGVEVSAGVSDSYEIAHNVCANLVGVCVDDNGSGTFKTREFNGGWIMGGATSGNQGPGTINATNYFINGTNISSATQTLTNKTFDTAGVGNSFLVNGVAVTANTGTGAVARATSPTLVTPVLGIASATSVTAPNFYGGSATGSTHTVQGTSNGLPSAAYVFLQPNGQFTEVGNGASPDALITINQNTVATTVALAGGTGLHLIGANATSNILVFDVFRNSTGGVNFFFARSANGTAASPAAMPASTSVFNIAAQGYDGISAYGSIATLTLNTVNQTSATDHSGSVTFNTVATGSSAAPSQRMAIFTGVIIGTGTTDPGAGQLAVTAMTQTSAVQSGTVCYSTTIGAITYDATLGCLASLEEMKDIHGPITNALAKVSALRPFWFTPIHRPAGSDLAEQPGFGAHQVEKVDRRLVGYDQDGNLRGVRYMEMSALLAAAIQELKHDNDNLRAEVETLKRKFR